MTIVLYRVFANGQESGPFTIGQLQSMWRDGNITADALYWSDGMSDWTSILNLVSILENQQRAPSAAPPPINPFPRSPASATTISSEKARRKTPFSGLSIVMMLLGLLLFGIGLLNRAESDHEERLRDIVETGIKSRDKLTDANNFIKASGAKGIELDSSFTTKLDEQKEELKMLSTTRGTRVNLFCVGGSALFVVGLVLRAVGNATKRECAV